MRSLLFAFLAISCGYLSAQSVSVGQWELRKRNANGTMTSYGITAENGKAIGFTADAPAMLAVGGSLTIGSSTITSGTSGRALYNNSGVLGELDLASLYAPISHNQAWSTITSTPTTLAGYGITDAITAATAASTYAPISHNQAWSTITSTPTTLAGYGITDAITAATAASTYAPIASPTFTGTITTSAAFGISTPEIFNASRTVSFHDGTIHWSNRGGSGYSITLNPSTPSATRIVSFNSNGALVSTADTGTVTSTMILDGTIANGDLAGSIALSKLALTGTPDGTKFLRDDGSWQTISLSGYLPLSGGTLTGPLAITGGTVTASSPPLSITQTYNGGSGVTHRGVEIAITNTSSNSASTLFRLLTGASGSTVAMSVNAATGATVIGASNNSVTLTLQGSDRSAVLNLGAFGNEFRVGTLQIGAANAALRFTDANAVARYGTIYGQDTDVLALRNGNAGTTGAAWEMLEMTAPGTPSADRVRVYVEDNGSGKSRLVVKWSNGTTTVLATQP